MQEGKSSQALSSPVVLLDATASRLVLNVTLQRARDMRLTCPLRFLHMLWQWHASNRAQCE